MIEARFAAVTTAVVGSVATIWLQAVQVAETNIVLSWGVVVTLCATTGAFFVTRARSESAHHRITRFQDEQKEERKEIRATLGVILARIEVVAGWMQKEKGIQEGEERAERRLGRRRDDERVDDS